MKNDGKFLKIHQTKLASCRQYKTDKRGLNIILPTFKNVCPSLNFENRPSLYRLIKESVATDIFAREKACSVVMGKTYFDKRNLPLLIRVLPTLFTTKTQYNFLLPYFRLSQQR